MSKGDEPRAAIVGCAGTTLDADEADLFRRDPPLGLILFARNVDTPDQVRALVDAFRDAVGRPDAPVLIDQEGGRVQRLRAPHWREAPPAARFGDLAWHDPAAACEAARLNARAIGAELAELGITVDCAPVLDVPIPGAHDVIGDRAFAAEPDTVAALGRAAVNGLLEAGVLPVIKHIPGHGRAMVDSHEALPRVDAQPSLLEASDFAPFKALHDAPWGMTAHVVYETLDREQPATTSRPVIEKTIRGSIGFAGFLISDDLAMKALPGPLAARAEAALAAGCDAVLHCSGVLEEGAEVLAAAPPLSDGARRRLARAEAMRPRGASIDRAAAVRQLDRLMSPVLG